MPTLLTAIDERLQALPQARLVALALVLLAAVSVLDLASGSELSMSLFYLFPVALLGWYGTLPLAMVMAVAASVCWYLVDLGGASGYSHPLIPVWNAGVRLGFFVVCGQLLARLRARLEIERQLARKDALTGLFSRRAFVERLAHDIELCRRRRLPLTLAYADLDGFKAVNDQRGHGEGDRVLQVAAHAMASRLRDCDTAARLGGDEFAVLLPDTGQTGASEVLERTRKAFAEAMAGGGWAVGCSIGAVTFENTPRSAEDALRAADDLMYQVKRAGKGAIRFAVVGDQTPPPG